MARLSAGPSPVIRRVNTALGSAWGRGRGREGGGGGGDRPAPVLLELSRSNLVTDTRHISEVWDEKLTRWETSDLHLIEVLRRLVAELNIL